MNLGSKIFGTSGHRGTNGQAPIKQAGQAQDQAQDGTAGTQKDPASENAIGPALDQINQIVLGKPERVKLAMACILAGGHLLIDDLPGTGKTVLAHALARTCGLDYKRLQFTSDLLPADIIGASIFDRNSGQFQFHQGAVFTQIFLADEINRASSKAQSALLEVMEERQVSVDGRTLALPKPFFVVATQNPLEQSGTFPLPESQLDRFLMCIDMGHPLREAEIAILGQEDRRDLLRKLSPVLSEEGLLAWQQRVAQMPASPALLAYIRDILEHTRQSTDYRHGLSTRAGLALLQAAKAWAVVEGEQQVLPGHVQHVLPFVVSHRLVGLQGKHANMDVGRMDVGKRVLDAVPVL